MKGIKKLSGGADADPRISATNIYISIMFLIFPLFVGFRGYEKLTLSKFLFFVIASLLWLLSLGVLSLLRREKLRRPPLHCIFALCFMAIVCISALLSPYGAETLLGGGRYDGLLSQLLYALIFMGVCRFGQPRRRHFYALGISLLLCSLIALLQLFDLDPLGFFPGDYSYYDKGTLYSGEFLGSMGNTNVLSEFLCLSLPLFFIIPVLIPRKAALLSLIPLLPAVFVTLRANVSGGLVALAGCALLGTCAVFSDLGRLRRGLAMLACCLVPAAAALAFRPDYTDRSFSCSFSFGPLPLLCLAGAVLLLAAAALLRGRQLPEKKLRLLLCGLCAAMVLAALAALYFIPFGSGTLHELSMLLHGKAEDSFGSSRILIWRECLAAWTRRPLFGSGPDTVALTVDIEFSRYVEETGKTLRSGVDNAHNIYLGYLVNTGLAGLISYISVLACGLVRWLKSLSDPVKSALGLSLLAACIQGFFALGLCLTAPLFWIMLGLLMAVPGKDTSESRKACPYGGKHE